MRQAISVCLLLLVCTATIINAAPKDSKKKDDKDGDKKSEKIGPVIGIDLGTTYSVVGVYRDGRVQIIANDQGNRITPSYVAFAENGDRLVGDAAKNQASLNPKNTLFDVKRLIGRTYTSKEVQHDKKLVPFEIVNKDNKPMIEVVIKGEKQLFAPEEISAMVLQKKTNGRSIFGSRSEECCRYCTGLFQ